MAKKKARKAAAAAEAEAEGEKAALEAKAKAEEEEKRKAAEESLRVEEEAKKALEEAKKVEKKEEDEDIIAPLPTDRNSVIVPRPSLESRLTNTAASPSPTSSSNRGALEKGEHTFGSFVKGWR